MTYLVVALDGPEPFASMVSLHAGAHGVWFKVGPLTLANWPADVHTIETVLKQHAKVMNLNVFYDAKLADHGPFVCGEVAKRLGTNGYASLSTSTDEATEDAVRGAKGSSLRVWRHVAPTSQHRSTHQVVTKVRSAIDQGAHGVICSAVHALNIREFASTVRSDWPEIDIICPGVRFDEEDGGGHDEPCDPHPVARFGVTHAVVGRPIWQSSDPVTAAKRYVEALRG